MFSQSNLQTNTRVFRSGAQYDSVDAMLVSVCNDLIDDIESMNHLGSTNDEIKLEIARELLKHNLNLIKSPLEFDNVYGKIKLVK